LCVSCFEISWRIWYTPLRIAFLGRYLKFKFIQFIKPNEIVFNIELTKRKNYRDSFWFKPSTQNSTPHRTFLFQRRKCSLKKRSSISLENVKKSGKNRSRYKKVLENCSYRRFEGTSVTVVRLIIECGASEVVKYSSKQEDDLTGHEETNLVVC